MDTPSQPSVSERDESSSSVPKTFVNNCFQTAPLDKIPTSISFIEKLMKNAKYMLTQSRNSLHHSSCSSEEPTRETDDCNQFTTIQPKIFINEPPPTKINKIKYTTSDFCIEDDDTTTENMSRDMSSERRLRDSLCNSSQNSGATIQPFHIFKDSISDKENTTSSRISEDNSLDYPYAHNESVAFNGPFEPSDFFLLEENQTKHLPQIIENSNSNNLEGDKNANNSFPLLNNWTIDNESIYNKRDNIPCKDDQFSNPSKSYFQSIHNEYVEINPTKDQNHSYDELEEYAEFSPILSKPSNKEFSFIGHSCDLKQKIVSIPSGSQSFDDENWSNIKSFDCDSGIYPSKLIINEEQKEVTRLPERKETPKMYSNPRIKTSISDDNHYCNRSISRTISKRIGTEKVAEKRKSNHHLDNSPVAKRVRSVSDSKDQYNQCSFVGSPVLDSTNFDVPVGSPLGDRNAYGKMLSDVNFKERKFRSQIQGIRNREQQYDNMRNEITRFNNVPLCPEELDRFTAHLKNENKLLKSEVIEMKLNLKHTLETVQGPMRLKLEAEKARCEQLQQDLHRASENMAISEENYLRKMNELKRQLCLASQNMNELESVNKKLKEEMKTMDNLCAKLEEDLVQQKLNEAETLKRLRNKKSLDEYEQLGVYKVESNLHDIARKLSKTIKECMPCTSCSSGIPAELKGAAKLIKDLTDMVDSRKDNLSFDSFTTVSRTDISCQSPPITEENSTQCMDFRNIGTVVSMCLLTGSNRYAVAPSLYTESQTKFSQFNINKTMSCCSGPNHIPTTYQSINDKYTEPKMVDKQINSDVNFQESKFYTMDVKNKKIGAKMTDKDCSTSEGSFNNYIGKQILNKYHSMCGKNALQQIPQKVIIGINTALISSKMPDSKVALNSESSSCKPLEPTIIPLEDKSNQTDSETELESSDISNSKTHLALVPSFPKTLDGVDVEEESKGDTENISNDSGPKITDVDLDLNNEADVPVNHSSAQLKVLKKQSRGDKTDENDIMDDIINLGLPVMDKSFKSLGHCDKLLNSEKHLVSSQTETGSSSVSKQFKRKVIKVDPSAEVVLKEDGLPFDIATKVELIENPPEGMNVTTCITASGNLEVVTEGPSGTIETILRYKEDGTLEVVTQIGELSSESSLSLLSSRDVSFLLQSASTSCCKLNNQKDPMDETNENRDSFKTALASIPPVDEFNKEIQEKVSVKFADISDKYSEMSPFDPGLTLDANITNYIDRSQCCVMCYQIDKISSALYIPKTHATTSLTSLPAALNVATNRRSEKAFVEKSAETVALEKPLGDLWCKVNSSVSTSPVATSNKNEDTYDDFRCDKEINTEPTSKQDSVTDTDLTVEFENDNVRLDKNGKNDSEKSSEYCSVLSEQSCRFKARKNFVAPKTLSRKSMTELLPVKSFCGDRTPGDVRQLSRSYSEIDALTKSPISCSCKSLCASSSKSKVSLCVATETERHINYSSNCCPCPGPCDCTKCSMIVSSKIIETNIGRDFTAFPTIKSETEKSDIVRDDSPDKIRDDFNNKLSTRPKTNISRSHPLDCECVDCICMPLVRELARTTEFYEVKDVKHIYQVTTNSKCQCPNSKKGSKIPVAAKAKPSGKGLSCICPGQCKCSPCGDVERSKGGPKRPSSVGKSPKTKKELCECAECACEACAKSKKDGNKVCCCAPECKCEKCNMESMKKQIEQLKAKIEDLTGDADDKPDYGYPDGCECDICNCPLPPGENPRREFPEDCSCFICDCPKAPGKPGNLDGCTCDDCTCPKGPKFMRPIVKRPIDLSGCSCEVCDCPEGPLSVYPKCDCVVCECNPCSDPRKKAKVMCDCEPCECSPCGDIKREALKWINICDCKECRCSGLKDKDCVCLTCRCGEHPPDCNCDKCLCGKDHPTDCKCPICSCAKGEHPAGCECEKCKCSTTGTKKEEKKTDKTDRLRNAFVNKCTKSTHCLDCKCGPCRCAAEAAGGALMCTCIPCKCKDCLFDMRRVMSSHPPDCTCDLCKCRPCDTPINKCKCDDCKCKPCSHLDDNTANLDKKRMGDCKCGEVCPCKVCEIKKEKKEKESSKLPKDRSCHCIECYCDMCNNPKKKGSSARPNIQIVGTGSGRSKTEVCVPKPKGGKDSCQCGEDCKCDDCIFGGGAKSQKCKCGSCACAPCMSGSKSKKCECTDCRCKECTQGGFQQPQRIQCQCKDCKCIICEKSKSTTSAPAPSGGASSGGSKPCPPECPGAKKGGAGFEQPSRLECQCKDCKCTICNKTAGTAGLNLRGGATVTVYNTAVHDKKESAINACPSTITTQVQAQEVESSKTLLICTCTSRVSGMTLFSRSKDESNQDEEDCNCSLCRYSPGADANISIGDDMYKNSRINKATCICTLKKDAKVGESENRFGTCESIELNVMNLADMDNAMLFKKISEKAKENDYCRNQIDEITSALSNIKSVCCKIEEKTIKPPVIKQASSFGQTMSGLKLALTNLQEKCKAKDLLIEAMTSELKNRINSPSFLRDINNCLRADAPDYDKATDIIQKTYEEKKRKAIEGDKIIKRKRASKVCKCGRQHKDKDYKLVDMTGFEVEDIRRITEDSIIIKWKPPKSGPVTGYDIFINGVNKSKVLSGGRTSAMVHSINLTATIQITVYAVTKCGRCEPPAIAIYELKTNSNDG